MNYGIICYILGWVLTIEAAFMFLPCICALVYQEQSGYAFLIVALAELLIGFICTRKKPKNQQFFTKEGFAVVGLSWIIMSIVGALPFCINGDIPSFTDALFETISGFTTTGASIIPNVELLSRCSLFWRSFTHWIGGMGVFVFLLAVLPMVGGYNMHLMRAESPGPSVGKLVPKIKDTAKILYSIYVFLTIMQFVVLLVSGMPVFDALLTTFGTAGTGGFGIRADGMGGYTVLQQWIVTIFMILFGVNFNSYFFLIGKNKKNAFKMEEVRVYFGIIFLSVVVITWNIKGLYDDVLIALKDAAFQVGSVMTSTGFATTDYNVWPEFSRLIIVLLMFVGACAGSTGGGIKVARIILLFKVAKQEIMAFVHPRSIKVIEMDGRAVDKNTIKGVHAFISVYAILFAVSWFLITLDGFDMVTNFTAVLATFNNIGPGLEMVGPAGNFAEFSALSKYVMMFDMLAGRLELFPILVLFTPSLWKKK